ncbi:MAG: hypothetical protein GWN31_07555 [Candidatus Thorarchaeota archaeon]|nr:hypothetical protein [Candidatus Thorarchaeota archaeon]
MQVEDLAQEVYMILVNNDCSPLKKFKGRWENSIYKYLGTTAVRVVLNRIEKAHAQKRPPNKKKYSINNPVPGDKSDRNVILEEILCTLEADAQMREKEFREEIEDCLDKMVARRRNGAVYREIYKYSLYEGLSPKLIQAHLAQQLSLSRINNIITEVKTDMQKCIQQKRRKNQ